MSGEHIARPRRLQRDGWSTKKLLRRLKGMYERLPRWLQADRVVVADVSAYEHLLKHILINLPGVDNLSSTFALRQVKYTTEYPLGNTGG